MDVSGFTKLLDNGAMPRKYSFSDSSVKIVGSLYPIAPPMRDDSFLLALYNSAMRGRINVPYSKL